MYVMSYPKHKIASIMQWLSSEPTPKDRATTALMGLWAGIWLGIISAFIYSNPVSTTLLFWFAIGGAISCSVVGCIFPKYPRILFLPFCLFSVGGIS